jgi:hypothetical protein
MNSRKKVRPSGDAGLVRPTYPELALGGTTLGAKDVNTGARESDPENPMRLLSMRADSVCKADPMERYAGRASASCQLP